MLNDRPTDRKVPTRRVALEATFDDLPRHFAADGDLLLSHFCAGLSALFPDGEDYFVRSVRHYRDRVTDPELKREVAGFIGQEAMHGREHRAFNARLAAVGYPTRTVEKLVKGALGLRTRMAPAVANLALTAALEHFTATMAELVLSDQETRDTFGHPGVWDLFVWHALEESEHKAVAFDVYRAVGGSERLRIWTMKLTRWAFVAVMVVQLGASLAGDRAAWDPRTLVRSLRTFRKAPVLQPAIWAQLKEYERPGFHPDDRDTSALVAQWRDRLFGAQGSMVDKLAGSAA